MTVPGALVRLFAIVVFAAALPCRGEKQSAADGKAQHTDPRFYYARWALGETLQLKGQLPKAMAEYQKAAEITDDPMVLALLAQGYAKTDQRDKARELLSQLEQLTMHRYVGPFIFALVHMALDENEKAIDDLERAYRERADPGIVGVKVEPLLDPLRGDPRFERLLANVLGSAEDKSPDGR
jgi:tetratricopeptide (TPR) repeat protein